MSARDPKREFAIEVVRRLREAGHQALWAGGCVRDLLLGRRPEDYDVATDAMPEQVRTLFGRRRTLAVGASFGVIIVLGPNKASGQVEVATFRSEGPYVDGRRPQHVRFTSAEEDARRRDFTINGMFYDPIEHRVIDYVGGEHDLGMRVVRAIGDPRERMREDKLRMLRAVRFAATLEFSLDSATAAAIREMAAEIRVVSAERIAQELRRMLVHPQRAEAVRLMHELGLLLQVFPELGPVVAANGPATHDSEWQRTLSMLALLRHPGFELAFAVLVHAITEIPGGRQAASSEETPARNGMSASGEGTGAEVHSGKGGSRATGTAGARTAETGRAVSGNGQRVRAICRRLRLSNRETAHIVWLVENRNALDHAPELRLAELKRWLAHRWIRDLLDFARVQILAHDGDLSPVMFCEDMLAKLSADEINPPRLLTGDDLRAAGLTPGPLFAELLEQVRDAQLEGRIQTREEALQWALRWAAEKQQAAGAGKRPTAGSAQGGPSGSDAENPNHPDKPPHEGNDG